jgi:hypothetical protein
MKRVVNMKITEFVSAEASYTKINK